MGAKRADKDTAGISIPSWCLASGRFQVPPGHTSFDRPEGHFHSEKPVSHSDNFFQPVTTPGGVCHSGSTLWEGKKWRIFFPSAPKFFGACSATWSVFLRPTPGGGVRAGVKKTYAPGACGWLQAVIRPLFVNEIWDPALVLQAPSAPKFSDFISMVISKCLQARIAGSHLPPLVQGTAKCSKSAFEQGVCLGQAVPWTKIH